MPFKNQRNSRDDNSKKQRNNSESFKSKGSQGKSNSDSKSGSYGKFSGAEDKKPYASQKRSGKPFSDKFGDKSFGSKEDRPRSSSSSSRSEGSNYSSARNETGRPYAKKFEDRADKPRGFRPSNKDTEGNSFRDRKSSDRPYGKSFDNKGGKSRDFNSSSRTNDRNEGSERRPSGRPFAKSFDDKGEKSKGYSSNRSTERDSTEDRKSTGRSFNTKFEDRGDKPRAAQSFSKDGDRNAPFAKKDDRPFRKRTELTDNTKGSEDFKTRDDKFKGAGNRKFSSAKRPASRSNAVDDGTIRLNRYISNSGICSRRKADELIAAGVISVNGEVITELGSKVDPAKDDVRYNNERLKREKMVYVLLNKPKDYITTTDDPQERKTVMQLISKATNERIYPVGRLDRNTTGLLLLTNDGNLADKLSHPRNSISKIYNVELDKSLSQGDLNKIEFGLELEDGLVKPDDISYVQGGSKREVGIQIHSGKNRIVRRIFESLGYDVVKLDRVVYANLTKKDLPRGRWRYLEERELVQLKHLIK